MLALDLLLPSLRGSSSYATSPYPACGPHSGTDELWTGNDVAARGAGAVAGAGAALAEVTAEVTMAVLILNLVVLLTAIDPLVQKAGKIEVMEILRKTLNLKVEEVEEKEEFLAKATP